MGRVDQPTQELHGQPLHRDAADRGGSLSAPAKHMNGERLNFWGRIKMGEENHH